MTDTGEELNKNNEQIVKYMQELKSQRDAIHFLIKKQEEERYILQAEIQRMSYKLTLVNKYIY